MEPAAATTTPPPSERHRSPKVKRQRSAAAQPLGDVTNLLLPSTPTNPTTGRPRPLPSDTTAAASTCSASPSHTPVSKPSSASGETTAPNPISARFVVAIGILLTLAIAAAEERSLVKSAISTVYTRRNTAQKRRTNDNTPFPAGTSSCPPPATLARKPLWLRVLGLFHPWFLVIDLKRRRARGWRIHLQFSSKLQEYINLLQSMTGILLDTLSLIMLEAIDGASCA
ncbi:hypothetical protein OsI_37206 [Oryza sativa Indica Group]|uniref:Uncharacterized protein n=2 Tax=Oryza sativa TaxID=4530 RepID=A3C7X0_ORYSJ|nr:hypothetical protein OsI_37206 [Oryza sativa Indica Group]EAZ17183.1 hypothetical protein OsJ_32690 [Oryza sativa Japonica Group]